VRPTAGSDASHQSRPVRQIEIVLHGPQTAYGMTVLEGVTSSARAEGVETVISRGWGGREAAAALLASDRAGAIFVTVDADGPDFEALHEAGLPVVVVDPQHVAAVDCVTIGATNFRGAVTATEHLLSLGHRRIGYAGGPASTECSQARLAGYASALRTSGLALEESLVTHGTFSYEAGLAAGAELLGRSEVPTAVFAASDEIALGVMEEARRRGIRVPDDLSVIGFDDTYLAARATPPLTTIAQPLVEMGQVAVQSLLRLMTGDWVGTSHVELATRLVTRGSTSAVTG
jgi:LacI family transcriptional regulator